LPQAGGGVRIQSTRYVEVDLEGLAPLIGYPHGMGAGISALNGGAFYWRVLTHF
jgi:hypothetical protein